MKDADALNDASAEKASKPESSVSEASKEASESGDGIAKSGGASRK